MKMKSSLFLLALVAAALGVSAAEPLRYAVAADRATCVYACGETATFTVTVTGTNGQRVATGSVQASLDNFGPQTVAAAVTWDLAKTNVFTLAGRLDAPGFLRLNLSPAPQGNGPKVWSVAYDPTRIAKGSPSPADFDAYWAGERARLRREVPLDPQVVRVPERSTSAFDFFRVSFATFGRRVYGYLSVPTDKTKAPFPVNAGVNAAGFGGWTNDMAGRPDAICLQMSVYPFEPDWRWQETGLKATYDAMNEACRAKYGCGYSCAGIAVSREDYFFHSVLLGIDRAIDWLVARPDVDRTRVAYQGTSQGGGFGFYLTGLNHAFTRAAFYVPAITDTMGYRAGRRSGWPQIVENNSRTPETRAAAERLAPYFDGANFASRIACPVRVAVGFSDTTCPPCAVYAAYNEIKVKDKEIVHGIGMTHSCFGTFYRDLGAWAGK